ncbi:MAG TPA: SDR family NAD(P)-dependent oxidoreductase [Minicystis sp.]|nr:SDR family NAD(P)-dependent oxidoreductase [Minicystis sp.]
MTPRCPESPRLDGKLAVVTGGNAGVGIEIARGLARRGAEVIVAARTASTAAAACERIARETDAKATHAALDLSDLESVVGASQRIREIAGGRPVDVLVANAGVWPREYATSKQGHEIAFATNTLGHHLLVRRMLEDGLLRATRVVVLTGDIYVRVRDCTSDFRYEGSSGGALAYCRSKLGNLWFAAELQRRHPELFVVSVHPGVIDSGLTGKAEGLEAAMKKRFLLDVEGGAQTPLFCATQPGLERGGYYHNTLGRVRLPRGDAAADEAKAKALWARLEELSAPYRAASAAA